MKNDNINRAFKALQTLQQKQARLAKAQSDFDSAKFRAIALLKKCRVGVNAAIDHHIINTEERQLTELERQLLQR